MAWQVIAGEVAARHLTIVNPAPEVSAPAPFPPGEPLTSPAAVAFALRSLNEGATASAIHRQLMDGGLPESDATVIVEQTMQSWRRDSEIEITKALLYAGLWCGGGIAVTALTYAFATPSGGTYIIAYGPVLYGGFRLIQLLTRLGHVKRQCDFPTATLTSNAV